MDTTPVRRRRLTQREIILMHLEQRGPLSARQAMHDYGVMRLAARIEELRRAGHPIRSHWVSVWNRYGDEVAVVEYALGARDEHVPPKGQEPGGPQFAAT